MSNYNLVFDEVILKQLKKLERDIRTKQIISKILDKIEELGPDAGNLIDSRLKIYEVKRKHPPIRLYYKIIEEKKEAYIFEYEMKTSHKKQQNIINKIKGKVNESKT